MLRTDRYRNLPIDLTMPGWGRGAAVGTYLMPALPPRSLSGVLRVYPAASPVPGATASPGASSTPGASPAPGATASPGASPAPGTPTPLETPPALYPQVTDTIAFRCDRIPQAIEDWRQNPIIGVGSNSFGQRHLDPTQINKPDHIAVLAVATLYNWAWWARRG